MDKKILGMGVFNISPAFSNVFSSRKEQAVESY
jgi:hypothetical protein